MDFIFRVLNIFSYLFLSTKATMKKFILFLILLFAIDISSQKLQKEIDSLKVELQNELPSNKKIQILAQLTKNYTRISIDSAFKYSNLGLELAKDFDVNEDLAELYITSGGVFFRKGDPVNSKKYFFKALKIRERLNDTLGVALAKANLVSYYGKYKKLDSAMVYAIEAVDVIEEKGNKRQANMLKANIGALYQLKYNYDKALEYYLSALEYSKKINFHNFTTTLYSNIAIIYNYKNDIQKSIESNLKSVEYAKKTNNNEIIANSLTNLGSVYFNNGETKKGLKTLEEALVYAIKYNSDSKISKIKYTLAKNYFKLSKFNESEELFKEVREHFINVNDKRKLFITDNYLGYIYAVKKDLKKMEFFKSYSDSISDVYMADINQKKMEELEVKYESEKKEKELLKTRTEKAETELELSKTRGWIYVLVGGLLILFILFFAINQRNKRKAQELITQEKERGFKAIIDAQEQERSKIARELHDGVVQQIGSVILKSRNLFSDKNLEDDKEAAEVLQKLENSNKDLRNISHQMMPIALKELGIIPALEDLLEGSLGYTKIKYSVEHFNIASRLPEKIEITIYRITQELINNIIKHSKATEVSVQLFKNQDNILLIVEDNGVGFSKQNSSKGIGLLNITSRLDMVNGNVNFEPSPNSGTLVTIKIPYKDAN